MGGLIAAGIIFTALVLALDEDGRPGFPAGVRLPAETAEGASWSPNGRWVAIPNRAGVLLRDPDGQRSRQLRAPRTPRHLGMMMPGRIGWSRDGAALRYVTTVGPEPGKGAWVTEVSTRAKRVRQAPLESEVEGVNWSSRGWLLVFATTGPRTALWSLERIDGKPRLLIDLPGRESRPELSPDATRVIFAVRARGTSQIWIAHADGSRPRRLAGPFRNPHYRWSPDSRSVAIIGGDPARRNSGLFLVSARDGKARELPTAEPPAAEPAWTPGGRWVTYATFGGRIEKVRARGGSPEEIAGFPDEWVRNLLWSPDGKRLAYSSVEVPEED